MTAPSSENILVTKLQVPLPRSRIVSRPRLTEMLAQSLSANQRLTLIAAPAGYGKTTLLAEWLANTTLPVAWLTLDAADNEPARFLSHLIASLSGAGLRLTGATERMLHAGQPPAGPALMTALINDLSQFEGRLVLVLDDYQVIVTPAIHRQLTFLLENQPAQLHLIVASREDPPFPLARLRARGQMTDIRQSDLRFTLEEAADFLDRVMDLSLSEQDVAALERRTEGWVAGLQLAAISMHGREDLRGFIRSFTGSSRYILDYLIEEVLQQQSPDTQDFLLQTSILNQLTGPMCNAVTERSDGMAMLHNLEQASLFVIPLDQSRQRYRYHRLFADLLRHRLETHHEPGFVAALHRRACQWYEADGDVAEAISHSLACADWERAAMLIGPISESMLKQGRVVTLLGWLRALPDEVVHANPQLCSDFSWVLILTEQLDAAESYLARVEQAFREQGREETSFLGEMAIARAHIARSRGNRRRTIELSEQALSLLPQDELSGRSIVAMNLGITQWHSGHLAKAEKALTEAIRAATGSGNDYAHCAALIFLNRTREARGSLRRAAASCRQIIGQGGQLPICGLAHFDLGRLLYEWNDLAGAAEHLKQGLELSQRGGGMEFLAGGYSTLALIKQAQGQGSAAQDALQKAGRFLEHPDISPATRLSHLAQRILVALAQGDLDTAALAVEGSPELEDARSFPSTLFLMLAQARLLLAQQRTTAASEQLAALQAMASQAGWRSVAIQTRALQALAASTHDEALAILQEALALAEAEGYIRTFVDAGEPMAALLREAASRSIAPEYVRKLLAAFPSHTPTLPPSPSLSPLLDPLSERELDVLRLLADGQTDQEIARALTISVNTVKTHLKNIYGKLGVHNRRDAAAKARELDLLP